MAHMGSSLGRDVIDYQLKVTTSGNDMSDGQLHVVLRLLSVLIKLCVSVWITTDDEVCWGGPVLYDRNSFFIFYSTWSRHGEAYDQRPNGKLTLANLGAVWVMPPIVWSDLWQRGHWTMNICHLKNNRKSGYGVSGSFFISLFHHQMVATHTHTHALKKTRNN